MGVAWQASAIPPLFQTKRRFFHCEVRGGRQHNRYEGHQHGIQEYPRMESWKTRSRSMSPEQDPVAGVGDLDAQADREVRFPGAGRPE